MLKRLVFLGMMLVGLAFTPRAQAQELVWVQVESQPRLTDAIDRARAYASLFPNVTGYRLGADWYTIVLGPYPRDEAEVQLRDLKREGTIPADSLITLGRRFGERYFPDGGLPAPTPEVSVIAPPLIRPPIPRSTPQSRMPSPPLSLKPLPSLKKHLPRPNAPRPPFHGTSGCNCKPPLNGSAFTPPKSTALLVQAPANPWPPGKRPTPLRPPAF